MKAVAKELNKEGKTQEEIGKLLGVSRSLISYWLEKNTTNVKIDKTCKPPRDCRVKVPKERYTEIKQRTDAGQTQEQVTADFKVSQQQISNTIKIGQEKEGEIGSMHRQGPGKPPYPGPSFPGLTKLRWG